MSCGISFTAWSMPARCLVALSIRAALGPSSTPDSAVMMVPSAKLYCRTRHSAALGSAAGGIDRPAVGGVDLGLLEKQGDLVDLAVVAVTLGQPVQSIVVAAYDLVFRRITAYFVIIYAESHHVHAHIGRGFIGILTVYALEKGIQHRKYLYVTVIVDCRGTVCFKMKRVDHVHIVEVGRSCFVCDVDRMFQRQAPHWKCFKFGISGLDTALCVHCKADSGTRPFCRFRAPGQ